jgi:hypothetical protein
LWHLREGVRSVMDRPPPAAAQPFVQGRRTRDQ